MRLSAFIIGLVVQGRELHWLLPSTQCCEQASQITHMGANLPGPSADILSGSSEPNGLAILGPHTLHLSVHVVPLRPRPTELMSQSVSCASLLVLQPTASPYLATVPQAYDTIFPWSSSLTWRILSNSMDRMERATSSYRWYGVPQFTAKTSDRPGTKITNVYPNYNRFKLEDTLHRHNTLNSRLLRFPSFRNTCSTIGRPCWIIQEDKRSRELFTCSPIHLLFHS